MHEEITFEIIIDSQKMLVKYEPDYIPRYLAHFEFHSPHQPRQQIPVSETGYRSQFVYHEEIKDVQDIKDYACQLARAMITQKSWQDTDEGEDEQLVLF